MLKQNNKLTSNEAFLDFKVCDVVKVAWISFNFFSSNNSYCSKDQYYSSFSFVSLKVFLQHCRKIDHDIVIVFQQLVNGMIKAIFELHFLKAQIKSISSGCGVSMVIRYSKTFWHNFMRTNFASFHAIP